MATIELVDLTRRHSGASAPALDRLTLAVPSGAFLALLGPSGCGKTTALRLIAGLDRPDGGSIRIGGAEVAGSAGFVPPQARRVGMVFQSYALWPHMSVAENVAFGLRARGDPAAARRARVADMLDLVGLSGEAGRRPHELSGGQRQRVGLARALAVEPQVILLDEPLANLDAHLREQMQAELRRIHAEARTTFVFVTHDQNEAMALATRVAVLDRGRLQQVDEPAVLHARPASPMVARFIGGGRLVPVRVLSRADGLCRIELQGRQFEVAGAAGAGDGLLCLRPREIAPAEISAPHFTAEIVEARFEGGEDRLTLGGPGLPDDIRLEMRAPPGRRVGERLALRPTGGWVMAAA